MKNLRILFFAAAIGLAAAFTSCKTETAEINPKLDEATLDKLIEEGSFKRANQILAAAEKVGNLSEADKYLISFEKDKMNRILGDFSLTQPEVLEYVKKYIPNADPAMIQAWVATKALEAKTIDGVQHFFRKGPSNLFLVDPICAAAKEAVEGPETGTTGEFLKGYLPKVISDACFQQVWVKDVRASSYVDPVKMTIHVLMRVMPGAVPEGEVVRMWLPFPKEKIRQRDIQLKRIFVGYNSDYKDLEIPDPMAGPALPFGAVANKQVKGKAALPYSSAATDGTLASRFYEEGYQIKGNEGAYMADGYIISSPDAARRSLYIEMVSNGKDTLKAGYDLSFTSYNQYFSNLENQIQPYDTTSLIYKTYTAERERHIVFTDKIKALADSLTAGVTEPYEKVKRIWCWITENIPWAGARDYSTIPNIPMYVLENGHGDCGQVSLLFMTMARYKGVPARWQSGWMLHPGHVNLHDWAEVYYEGVGWVPVDQSFGYSGGDTDKADTTSVLTDDQQMLKFFFSKGLDAYRLIVNDEYGKWAPLYPAKIYPHNDEVDFQMGEAEWRGGNILNGGWKCWMDVDYE